MMFLIAALGFTALALVGYGLSLLAQNSETHREEISDRLQTMTGRQVDTTDGSLLKDLRLSSIPALDVALGGARFTGPLVRLIRQAGVRRRPGEVLLYIALVGAIAFLFLLLAGIQPLLAGAIGMVLALLPIVFLQRMRRRRTLLFGEQLPEALDLVRSALQAGHGMIASFQVVADTLSDPVGQEFLYVVEENRLGLPLREALTRMTERVAEPNLPILIIGLVTAQEVGGNMAEVIENITHTIRERSKLHREISVLTTQGRMSGWVLTALPVGVGVMMQVVDPHYYDAMLSSPSGQNMLGYVVLSILLGNFVIRRLLRLRV